MDTSWPVFLPLSIIENLKTETNAAHYAKKLMVAYCKNFAPKEADPKFRFHDPCVLLTALFDQNFQAHRITINCDENNSEFGRINITEDGKTAFIYNANTNIHKDFLDKTLKNIGISIS